MDAAQQIISDWQEYSDRSLTDEDVREIVENLDGYFSILARWKREREDAEKKIPPESH